jgi:RNA-binding protein YlmH
MIGNKYVELEEWSLEVISNYKKNFENKEIIVSSLRIDNVIARILNTSRNIIKEKIKNKEIILNYDTLKNNSYILKNGDIFSIRKQGKYKFLNILKTTKKDNYIIEYQKYL